MAKQFLERLPKIPLGDLPADSSCMICLNTYGARSENGTIESPVRLPCTHHVGLECLTIWLSANKSGRISCPYCRRGIFPIPPPSYRVIEDDREEAAYGEDLHEIRTRRRRIEGLATGQGEGNHRTELTVAEVTAALQVMDKAFGLLVLGIVVFVALKFLF